MCGPNDAEWRLLCKKETWCHFFPSRICPTWSRTDESNPVQRVNANSRRPVLNFIPHNKVFNKKMGFIFIGTSNFPNVKIICRQHGAQEWIHRTVILRVISQLTPVRTPRCWAHCWSLDWAGGREETQAPPCHPVLQPLCSPPLQLRLVCLRGPVAEVDSAGWMETQLSSQLELQPVGQ